MEQFALGFLLGLVPGLALLAYEHNRRASQLELLVQRVSDAFHAGVAVKLAREPSVASAELFRLLRDRISPLQPTPKPTAPASPQAKPVPAEQVWHEGTPGDFEFGMSVGQFAAAEQRGPA